ncbi:MAG: hypothetical protein RL556_385 [Actinomycetota bacterium]|jgi:pilus assembly protein CpaE
MVIIFSSNVKKAERARVIVGGQSKVLVSKTAVVDYVTKAKSPTKVVITEDIGLEPALALASQLATLALGTAVVLIRQRLDVSTLSAAMRSQVNEVVEANDAQSLVEALARTGKHLQRSPLNSQEPAKPAGKVVLVFSPKGGCGKTTVATNLAFALSANFEHRVALVDLDLQFGDVAIALQLDPVKTIADALRLKGALDANQVRSLLVDTNRENLKALLAPVDPSDIERITTELVEQVLENLKQEFDFVVVDTAPALNESVIKAIDLANEILLLTNLDVASVKNLKVAIDTMAKLDVDLAKTKVVVNRSTAKSGFDVAVVESMLNANVATSIAASDDVARSLNRGVPVVVAKPRSPASKALIGLASLVSKGVQS